MWYFTMELKTDNLHNRIKIGEKTKPQHHGSADKKKKKKKSTADNHESGLKKSDTLAHLLQINLEFSSQTINTQ